MAYRTRSKPPGVDITTEGRPSPGRPNKYPWPNWTDGAWWIAARGVDFSCSVQSFRTALSEVAAKRNLKYHSSVTSERGAPRETIAFQFYRETPDDLLIPEEDEGPPVHRSEEPATDTSTTNE